MIIKVSGDILLTQAQAVAHGIAPHDHFNQGLALALRERFPAMARDFRHYCHLENPAPGGAWLWAGPEKVVVCLMTQDAAQDEGGLPGKASEKHIAHALKELRRIVEEEDLQSIALPRLASGVGGMDWGRVEPFIQNHLGDLDIPVYVYETYIKGHKAQENRGKAA